MSENIVTLTDDNFEAEVLKSELPVLVDFWAPWCGPCVALAPTLQNVADELTGKVKIGKLEIDENKMTALDYGIRSIPTLILMQSGKEVSRFVGGRSKTEIIERLKTILNLTDKKNVMKTSIFLGGTVGNANWRSSFIADLVLAGVPKDSLYDPVVRDWTPECQAAEDLAKSEAQYNLFYICDPKQEGNPVSIYSLVEATMGLYDQPSTTVVVFDNTGYNGNALKSLTKSENDLRKRFPAANIFSTRDEAVNFFIMRLGSLRPVGVVVL